MIKNAAVEAFYLLIVLNFMQRERDFSQKAAMNFLNKLVAHFASKKPTTFIDFLWFSKDLIMKTKLLTISSKDRRNFMCFRCVSR